MEIAAPGVKNENELVNSYALKFPRKISYPYNERCATGSEVKM